jgi:cysteinyl-tRNA synthetase
MHIGFLLKNSEKMSKSTGNFDRLVDLINKGYHPLALRYFILNSNYRKTTDFSYEALTSSQNALFSIYEFADKIKAIKKLAIFKKIKIIKNSDNAILLEKHRTDFFDHLNDDLNTPKALETL